MIKDFILFLFSFAIGAYGAYYLIVTCELYKYLNKDFKPTDHTFKIQSLKSKNEILKTKLISIETQFNELKKENEYMFNQLIKKS